MLLIQTFIGKVLFSLAVRDPRCRLRTIWLASPTTSHAVVGATWRLDSHYFTYLGRIS